MVFVVNKWAFETNSSALTQTKILVTMDQVQEAFLSGWMETTTTNINEAFVQRLTNNVVFQIGWTSDASPGKILHYRISPLVGKTLLLYICQLEANLSKNFVSACVQFFIVQISIDVTNFFNCITRIISPLDLLGENKLYIDRIYS